jgi:hypothetical protein
MDASDVLVPLVPEFVLDAVESERVVLRLIEGMIE